MPTVTYKQRTFDARPDRIDLRDRIYQPWLRSLPKCYPDIDKMFDKIAQYAKLFILDQEQEGACTGFGLAATINYLRWKNQNFNIDELQSVSPRMLYHLAQMYDEWAGEDYEGSSCRGAMKGWHRHGVCVDAFWPYRDENDEVRFVKAKSGWDTNAALNPLGSYYRIDAKSITDMQSAIYEVGAIYVSASVHDGWYLKKQKSLSIIPFKKKSVGGHAFAIVGYNEDGFIIQNSWGPDWGYHGFAILAYEDWVHNGDDAWVAVLGAPMRIAKGASAFSTVSLQDKTAAQAVQKSSFKYKNEAALPMSDSEAYLHTIVLDNNGIPINKVVTAKNAQTAFRSICLDQPFKWLEENKAKKIALYVHGGLNSEADSIERVQYLAPYFLGNGIYPIFVTWKTGILESIVDIFQDSTRNIFPGNLPDRSILDKIQEKFAEARDRAIEAASERILVKPIWSQIKQNADAAASGAGGIKMLAELFDELRTKLPDVEIHLAGHSAGSLVLGHLLSLMQNITASTLTLFAPACTVEFANKHYGDAITKGRIAINNFHVDIMDDERELADTVGPYGKSLLYLVSRALESYHKMPLLGMEGAWNPALENIWSHENDKLTKENVADWLKISAGVSLRLHDKKRKLVSTGSTKIKLAHGSFDNDVEVVTKMLERIRGDALVMPVENLAY